MILEEMFYKVNLLIYFKNELTNKGHTLKSIAWIDGQLDLSLNHQEYSHFFKWEMNWGLTKY